MPIDAVFPWLLCLNTLNIRQRANTVLIFMKSFLAGSRIHGAVPVGISEGARWQMVPFPKQTGTGGEKFRALT